MNEWISVKISIPEIGRLCKVQKSNGTLLQPVRLKTTSDDCTFDGIRYDWIYKSGIHASSLEPEDIWDFIDE